MRISVAAIAAVVAGIAVLGMANDTHGEYGNIPEWLSDLSKYYINGSISEPEYVAAARYMVDNVIDMKEPDLDNPELVGTVMVRVIDGNTVQVQDKRIRLSLVDVKDSGDTRAPHAVLARVLCPVGAPTWYDEDDRQLEGSYGRLVGMVYCNAGISLNELMVGFGLGWVNTYYCQKSELPQRTGLDAPERECGGFTYVGQACPRPAQGTPRMIHS